ncbi:Glycerophosphoryl diester phosphodiesterase [Poriferisphaera corsica]|uniref:Glycerophosphoryl diester phosphodiesterase n=1 Tax=Poriferisphaera corsica TaxID=2528020 RepID=A0A517YPT3_9BACT|nr:glycerophosphodiester phosphodiesterase family protein [Poriferisphaera corsica]QDU32233.1 Glycerophosphoryl diester phosphodiesterase [Poriferisphaera corsica]
MKNATFQLIRCLCITLLLISQTSAKQPSNLGAPDRHPNAKIAIVAHRGANNIAPENTFAAAKFCHKWNLDFIEIDIRTSADGIIYLIHDLSIEKFSDKKISFNKLHSDQIDQIDAGLWFDDKYKGESIPRLRNFLQWARGHIKVYIDIKDVDPITFIQIIEETKMSDQIFYWSNSEKIIREIRRIAPEYQLKMNAHSVEKLIEVYNQYRPEIIEVRAENLTRPLIEKIHSLNMKAMVYTTRNDEYAFSRAIQLNCDMFNTNHPRNLINIEHDLLSQQNHSNNQKHN